MPTEDEVEAGAKVMADLPTIDAPKLPAPCWMGSVREILVAAEKVREVARKKNCTHPRRVGNGMVSSDGASESYWSCPDCGAHDHVRTPPRTDGRVVLDMPMNWPRV